MYISTYNQIIILTKVILMNLTDRTNLKKLVKNLLYTIAFLF